MTYDCRFRITISGPQCLYCGLNANSLDHFPPRSMTVRGFLLPACRECNCLAGTEYGLDLRKRINMVKEKIARKYKKILEMPVWSSDDLDELEGNIKRKVIKCQKDRRIASSRIAWNAESYLASIDLNKDFVRMLAGCDITTE